MNDFQSTAPVKAHRGVMLLIFGILGHCVLRDLRNPRLGHGPQ